LCKTSAIIRNITGQSSQLFRPPGGNFSGTVRKAAARHGMSSIFWTLNCGPYEGGDPQTLADYVTRNIRDGAIVLMHNGEPAAVNALPIIVNDLRARGYEFVTVPELLGTK
jgi:peptidoglycan/xylan/chitin deacetylase (PgdA/CDA1 family)